MWQADKARYALYVERVRLNLRTLLFLVVVCNVPLLAEQDTNGTHAWESLSLAFLGIPVWLAAVCFKPWFCRRLSGLSIVVYSALALYEGLLVLWHLPLLFAVRALPCWYDVPPHCLADVPWGWLPGHALLLCLAVYGAFASVRFRKMGMRCTLE